MPRDAQPNSVKPMLLLTLAALLTILPLLIHGVSCGQDQVFHLQSWFDAAHQLRHGHYPHWAYTAAWNAGEPRFLFYPPLSWLLGAVITMHVPPNASPVVYIFLALTAAGLAFFHLAKHFVSTNAALLASAFYLANPYMLFNAFERSALAELLAAAWIPLLLLGVLRDKPTVRGIAVPLALLWLTNAPAAVMGSYTLALLATIRVLFCHSAVKRRNLQSGAPTPLRQTLRLALTCLSGTLLGLALPAYYLLPAAVERKFIQVAMAIIPNMRFQDNFLFAHTADAAHNAVNHTASTLALTLLALTTTLISALLLTKKPVSSPEASRLHAMQSGEVPVFNSGLAPTLALLTLLITFLLVPLSTPIWSHLPELAFLQFPWRLLTLLSAVLALALALLLDSAKIGYPDASASGLITPKKIMGFSPQGLLLSATLLLPLALTFTCYHLYAQACDPHDIPASIAQLLHTHHGLGPTDEYTPTAADNDYLRTNNPGYWLAAQPSDPAPNTTPTATELHPDILTDDTPVPVEQTLSQQAPTHITLNLTQPRTLVLNLRDYPNWRVTRNATELPTHLQRDDGLLAIALPAGPSTIHITWHRTFDQTLGLTITLFALLVLTLTFFKQHGLWVPRAFRLGSHGAIGEKGL